MHHVGHVDWDFSEPPAGYAGSAEGYSRSCLVGSHTGAAVAPPCCADRAVRVALGCRRPASRNGVIPAR
jgi:hypothetical protein